MRRWNIISVATGIFIVFAAAASFAGHALVQPDGDRLHWRDNDPGFPRGYVYWHDKTGTEWPVFASAIEWDKETRLDAVYVSGGSSCTSSHCATVKEADLNAGCSAPFGVTDIPAGSGGHFTTDVEVRIDRQCDSRNSADRRELVCHEMGHSIGLGHRPQFGTESCMRVGDMIGKQFPDAHDFGALHTTYNHNDPG